MHWAAPGLVSLRVVSGLQGWARIKKGDLMSQHNAASRVSGEVGPPEWCWHAVLGWGFSFSSDTGRVQGSGQWQPCLEIHVGAGVSSLPYLCSDHSALSGLQHSKSIQWKQVSCMLCVPYHWYPGQSFQPLNWLHVNSQKVLWLCHAYLFCRILRSGTAPKIFLDLHISLCLINVVMVCSHR